MGKETKKGVQPRSETFRHLVLTPGIIAALRVVLTAHNALEEGPGGLYETCKQLAGVEAQRLLTQLQAAPAGLVTTSFTLVGSELDLVWETSA
jgi:hypothetical protein